MESEELEAGNEDVAVKVSVEGNNTEQVMEIFDKLDGKVKEVL